MKWFSVSGIVSEIKNIKWPTFKELVKDSRTVLSFTIAFGIYFVLCQTVISALLKIFGIGIGI